jgi:hypothetical protein
MTNPGPTASTRSRVMLRLLGLGLVLLGATGIVAGAVLFGKGALSDDMAGMGRLALIGIGLFGGGGLLAVGGLAALSAGFRGTRYVRAETLPVVTDPTALFADDPRRD